MHDGRVGQLLSHPLSHVPGYLPHRRPPLILHVAGGTASFQIGMPRVASVTRGAPSCWRASDAQGGGTPCALPDLLNVVRHRQLRSHARTAHVLCCSCRRISRSRQDDSSFSSEKQTELNTAARRAGAWAHLQVLLLEGVVVMLAARRVLVAAAFVALPPVPALLVRPLLICTTPHHTTSLSEPRPLAFPLPAERRAVLIRWGKRANDDQST